MVRYTGQELPEHPKIAVIASDAIGNFVMTTPLLRLLRAERSPSRLDLYCGSRTRELQDNSSTADHFYELHGSTATDYLKLVTENRGLYDLVINCESTGLSKTTCWLLGENALVSGPCIGTGGRGDFPYPEDERGKLWSDRSWISNDLVLRYPFLKSPFISEIFARLCYLEGDLPHYDIPRKEVNLDVPDIVISAAASLPEKLWPVDRWIEITNRLARDGHSIGLVGAKPEEQQKYWKGGLDEEKLLEFGAVRDLRGQYSMPEVVDILGRAKCVLTIDNGILHLSVAAGTPTVGLYRFGFHRLWAPPYANLQAVTPGEGNPVSVIPVERVIDAVNRAIR